MPWHKRNWYFFIVPLIWKLKKKKVRERYTYTASSKVVVLLILFPKSGYGKILALAMQVSPNPNYYFFTIEPMESSSLWIIKSNPRFSHFFVLFDLLRYCSYPYDAHIWFIENREIWLIFLYRVSFTQFLSE